MDEGAAGRRGFPCHDTEERHPNRRTLAAVDTVDPGFLKGQLHREGGVGFFLLALAMLVLVFVLLRRSEMRTRIATSTSLNEFTPETR